eukprot:7617464-Pyramimonas_sp.AAC.1
MVARLWPVGPASLHMLDCSGKRSRPEFPHDAQGLLKSAIGEDTLQVAGCLSSPGFSEGP